MVGYQNTIGTYKSNSKSSERKKYQDILTSNIVLKENKVKHIRTSQGSFLFVD
jgi:hypothetical protein